MNKTLFEVVWRWGQNDHTRIQNWTIPWPKVVGSYSPWGNHAHLHWAVPFFLPHQLPLECHGLQCGGGCLSWAGKTRLWEGSWLWERSSRGGGVGCVVHLCFKTWARCDSHREGFRSARWGLSQFCRVETGIPEPQSWPGGPGRLRGSRMLSVSHRSLCWDFCLPFSYKYFLSSWFFVLTFH